MTIQAILAHKGNKVITIRPDASIAEAAGMLAEHRIGAIVVSADGAAPGGILSERDIVRALSVRGAAILDQPVSQYMTTQLVTMKPESTVHDAMKMMTERKFRHLPIVKDGKLVGIVSIGDIVSRRLGELETEAEAMRSYIGGQT